MADTSETRTPAEREARLMATLTNSAFILTVLACLAAAHWLQDLLTPLLVAIFALILIDALAMQVGRIIPKSPDWVRVGAAFVLMSLFLGAAGALIVHSTPAFASSILEAVGKAQSVGYQLSNQLNLPHGARFESIDLKPFVSGMLSGVRQLATGVILVLVYLGFILASRRSFDHKISILFPTPRGRSHAERVFRRVRDGAESYVGLQAFKGLLLGVIFFVLMKLFGMHNALFLAFLVFLASFIPILGPAAAVAAPTLLALAQYDWTWRPLVLAVCLEITVIVIDSILLPRLQGERLDVDPVVVLVSLGFWSLLFGIVGALLSTVLTVVVIAVSAETQRLRWLAVVLSKGGEAAVPGAH